MYHATKEFNKDLYCQEPQTHLIIELSQQCHFNYLIFQHDACKFQSLRKHTIVIMI